MKLLFVDCESDEEIDIDTAKPIIVGRGPLLRCYDKRVSRNHCSFHMNSSGNVLMVSLHSNPCFIMENGLPPVHKLSKNETKQLNHGDYFGLLPDCYWYKIVLKDKEEERITNSSGLDLKLGGGSSMESREKANSEASSAQLTVLEEKLKALENTKKLPVSSYEIDNYPGVEDNNELHKTCSLRETNETEKLSKNVQNGVDDSSVSSSTANNGHLEFKNPNVPAGTNFLLEEGENAGNTYQNRSTEESVNNFQTRVEKQNTDDCTTASNSESKSNSKRHICQYEGNCYRKNQQHKIDYCHPGDPDFVPYKSRPVCQYGSSCYRRNASHRVEYQHPQTSKSPPAKNVIQTPKRKKRKKEMFVDSTDEDEYDLEDPFIDDATSEEYIPSDLSDDGE